MNQREVTGYLNDSATGVDFDHGVALSRIFQKWKGKQLQMTIQPLRKRRSDNQNRWLWGVAYPIIKMWYKETQGESITSEEIHAHNLQSIQGYKYEVKEMLGQQVLVSSAKKSSKMSTIEFNEMMEKLQKYYAQRDCVIPDPNGTNHITNFI